MPIARFLISLTFMIIYANIMGIKIRMGRVAFQ